MPTINLTPKENVITREIEGQLVLYDPTTDAVHTLNTTAQFVWENIEMLPEQITTKLQTNYQVSPGNCSKRRSLHFGAI